MLDRVINNRGWSLRNRPRISEADGIATKSASAPRAFMLIQTRPVKIVPRKSFITQLAIAMS
jgi:hypothetical protein